jgi:hypothetical protein
VLAGPGERQVVGGSRVLCAGRRFGVRPVAQDWREFAGGGENSPQGGGRDVKNAVFSMVFGGKYFSGWVRLRQRDLAGQPA